MFLATISTKNAERTDFVQNCGCQCTCTETVHIILLGRLGQITIYKEIGLHNSFSLITQTNLKKSLQWCGLHEALS